ncbi:hypothetical protein VHARVF571_530117 [Vibrio harveyi]|nr:hypothetical protein VHARVF571_530117 [Vibrio harveyi]
MCLHSLKESETSPLYTARQLLLVNTSNKYGLYPSHLEVLGSARMTWFVDAAVIQRFSEPKSRIGNKVSKPIL